MRCSPACLGALVGLAAAALALAATAGATADYTGATRQPCLTCHTTSAGPELSARGQAFAAVGSHKSDPAAAWAEVAGSPAPTSPDSPPGGPIIPAAVLALALVGSAAAVLLRRRPGPA